MARPSTVEEYLAGFEGPARERLEELRDLARREVPQATEELKWGTPAYSTRTILFVIAAYRHHANIVFTPSTREAFADRLGDYETGKGSVKLPYDRPVPGELLAEMIRYRVDECEEQGVTWM